MAKRRYVVINTMVMATKPMTDADVEVYRCKYGAIYDTREDAEWRANVRLGKIIIFGGAF